MQTQSPTHVGRCGIWWPTATERKPAVLTAGARKFRAGTIPMGAAAAQAAGKVRIEGKDYVMRDDDVVPS